MTKHPEAQVQVSTSVLQSLVFHHVRSALRSTLEDASEAGGYTEWTAGWLDRQLTMSWDWYLRQQLMLVVNPAAIRTNISVCPDRGRAESALLTRVYLLEKIETLPWRATVMGSLSLQPHR